MNANLGILGLILDFIGFIIIFLVSYLSIWHNKDYSEKWTKRYWWHGFYIGREPNKPFFKRIRIGIKRGCIPPKHQWEIVAFLYILAGLLLQLKYYLS